MDLNGSVAELRRPLDPGRICREHQADIGGRVDDQGDGAGGGNRTTAAKPLEGKAGAALKGRVTLKGKAPDIAALTQQFQAADEVKPDQKEACFDMAPDAEKSEQMWTIGKDNGVGNVVVWIQPAGGDYFKIDPAKPTWPPRSN